MTERRDDGPDAGRAVQPEADLRDVISRGASAGSGYGQKQFEAPPEAKLPPVWPGDEDQPWFRRERGLPPLPEEKKLGPGDFPTPPALPQVRARAWGVSYGLPIALNGFIVLAPIGMALLVANIFFFSKGQDVGCLIFKTRVLRENGDVAGFFHMWTRAFASIISLLAFGAGFWTALSDPEGRTWHDKWMKTYVVQDSEEYRTRKRSSAQSASSWFWITTLVFIIAPLMITIMGLLAESAPPPQ